MSIFIVSTTLIAGALVGLAIDPIARRLAAYFVADINDGIPYQPWRSRYRLAYVAGSTALLALWLVTTLPTTLLALALCLACYLVLLSLIDIDALLLPDLFTYPLAISAICTAYWEYAIVTWPDALLGWIVGYTLLSLINGMASLLIGHEAFGQGDSKLGAALCACLGWQLLPSLIMIAGLIALPALLLCRHTGRQYFAFGPCLALASLLALPWHTQLIL